MSKNKLILIGLTQALSVFVYILLVAIVMSNGNEWFGKEDKFLTPVAMLLLFVLSAAITGALVLGKAILLYLDGLRKEAIKLFGYTLAWLALIALAVFIVLALWA